MKILATADWQLDGKAFGGDWLAEQESVCRKITGLAHEEEVDAIVLAGDLFERREPTPRELHVFQRVINGFPVYAPILAIPGNGRHDGNFYGQEIALDLFDRLTVHREPGIEEIGGVTFCTLPWMSDSWFVAQLGGRPASLYEAEAEHLTAVARGMRGDARGPAVLVAHWGVEDALLPSGLPFDAPEPMLPIADLEAMRWDAAILGHVHRRQLLGSEDAAGPMLYTGPPYASNHGEAGCDHGCWILEGPPFEARFVPFESRRFVTLDEHLGVHDQYGLELACSGPDLDGAIVRIRVRGTQDEARSFSFPAVKRAALAAGAWRAEVDTSKLTRAQSARVAGMTDELDETQALRMWCEANQVEEALRPVLVEAHEAYVAAAR